MADDKKFKAVVTFGGSLDSSWTRSARTLEKSLSDVGKTTQKLTREQGRLAAELKKAKLAGQSIGELSRQYQDVTRQIHKAQAEQKKLNAGMQKAQQLEKFGHISRGLFQRGLSVAGKTGGMLFPWMTLGGGGGLVASALGSLIMPAARNAQTAEQAGVAKSYGVDVPTFSRWDQLARQFGLKGENIGDLFEEYLHKAGEYKQTGKQGALRDAFDTLGFKGGELAGLSNLQQFDKIIERALSLKDTSKASFALDSLFGGEASKLLMLIKQSGKSYRDLMEEQKRYNLITKAGAEGAVEGARAVGNLQTVFSSALSEISGLLGGELSPQIRKITDNVADWFRNGGITRIVSFLKTDLYPGMVTFAKGIVEVGRVVYALARKLSWLVPDEGKERRNLLEMMGRGRDAGETMVLAKAAGQEKWLSGLLNAHPDLPQTLRRGFDDTHHLFKKNDDKTWEGMLSRWADSATSASPFGGKAGASAPAGSDDNWRSWVQKPGTSRSAPVLTDNRRVEYHFQINGAPGQSPQAIAGAVADMTTSTSAFTGDSLMLDRGEAW